MRSETSVPFNMLMPKEVRNYIKNTSKNMGISESLFVREILKTIMEGSKSYE